MSAQTRPAAAAQAEHARMWDELSGAELIQAMADGAFPHVSQVDEHLGMEFRSAESGLIAVGWTPGEHLCNPGGIVHGGYVAMILDNAVCLAGSSTCEHFMPMLTLNLNVDYLRPVQAGVPYTVTGTCVHPGRTRMVANAAITDADGRVFAQASASVLPNRAFDR
ncbi:PaaI family thioesterase [Actinomadura oligospora]|uniref:PaaI family thioesterase n=1 Tax=Actinomadura oligospora TaxID=111804 RepID=UPI001FE23A45|nr:PaaI family thioesterase [Actinomadura oligospora]